MHFHPPLALPTTHTATPTTLSASSPAPNLPRLLLLLPEKSPFTVSTEIKSSAVMSHDREPSQDCDDGKTQFSPPPGGGGSDQMAQQNGGGSKRKRVSLACNACRTRKSKVSCSLMSSPWSRFPWKNYPPPKEPTDRSTPPSVTASVQNVQCAEVVAEASILGIAN